MEIKIFSNPKNNIFLKNLESIIKKEFILEHTIKFDEVNITLGVSKIYSNVEVLGELCSMLKKHEYKFTQEHTGRARAAITVELDQNIKPTKSIISDMQIAKKFLNKYKDAEERNIECTLSFRRFKQLCRQEKCQITGIEFVDIENHPNSLSIDRIDNSKGYHDDNVIACTKCINEKKDSLSIEEIKQLYALIVRKKL